MGGGKVGEESEVGANLRWTGILPPQLATARSCFDGRTSWSELMPILESKVNRSLLFSIQSTQAVLL
jgi:hypothetical protein